MRPASFQARLLFARRLNRQSRLSKHSPLNVENVGARCCDSVPPHQEHPDASPRSCIAWRRATRPPSSNASRNGEHDKSGTPPCVLAECFRGHPDPERGPEPSPRVRTVAGRPARGDRRGRPFDRRHACGRPGGCTGRPHLMQTGRGKGNALACGFAAARATSSSCWTRMARPTPRRSRPSYAALAGRRRLRQGLAVRPGRRQQRHHRMRRAATLDGLGRNVNCTGTSYPTSATASTPWAAGICRC